MWPWEGFGDHFDPAATDISAGTIQSRFSTCQHKLTTKTASDGDVWTTDENYQPFWSNGFEATTYSIATVVPSWVTTGIGAPPYTMRGPGILLSTTFTGGGTATITQVDNYKFTAFGLPDIFITFTTTVQLGSPLLRVTQNNLGLAALQSQPFDPLPSSAIFAVNITWPDSLGTTQRTTGFSGLFFNHGAASNLQGTPPSGFIPTIVAMKSKVRIGTAALLPELWATLFDSSMVTQTPLDLTTSLPVPGTYIFTPYTAVEEGHAGSDIPTNGASIPYLPPYAATNYGWVNIFGGATGPF